MNIELIKGALAKLDTANNDHWTSDGAPRLEAVNKHLPAPVTRKDLNELAPSFTRDNPSFEAPEPVVAAAPKATGAALLSGASGAGDDEDADNVGAGDDGELPQADERPALTARQQEINKEVEDLEREVDILRGKISKLRDEDDAIIGRLAKIGGAETNADAIRGYLDSQRDLRARRAAALAALRSSQSDPSLVAAMGPSKLDRVMASSRGHGNQRPQRFGIVQPGK